MNFDLEPCLQKRSVYTIMHQVMSSMANLHARFDELESKVQSIAADTEQVLSSLRPPPRIACV